MARSLSTTLAMLQMHVVPDAEDNVEPEPTSDLSQSDAQASFVHDLFSGVLTPLSTQ